MTQQRVLITGGYGCIGSEATKWILRNTDARVTICSRSVSSERTNRVFHDVDQTNLRVACADVSKVDGLESILRGDEITHVVHMAALQTPDCNAHRDLGLQINLAGTQNLIETMKRLPAEVQRFVFASSIAVYGPRSAYPAGTVPMLAEPKPVNVYGAWKLAGEQISKFYHEDTGVPTVCLRPGVLFGPGRDAGLTSTPTTAMKCVALGRDYEIPFRSVQDYLYAPDVGAAVAMATLEPFEGLGVFTLPSHTVSSVDMQKAIQLAAEKLGVSGQCAITVADGEVPFICELEYEPLLKVFPQVPHTDLGAAVLESIQVFLQQKERGWLTEADVQ